jgi:hypothetical protein
MTYEYVIIAPRPWEAKIFLDQVHGEEVAEIKKGEDQKSFKLIRKNDGLMWTLTNKVHGEFRPFSIAVLNQNRDNDINKEVLTIREHLFKYGGKFYMLTNHPEGKHWNEYLSGIRYISRLDNFPYSTLIDIDHNIKHDRGTNVSFFPNSSNNSSGYIGISSVLGYLPPSATEDAAGFFGFITEII